MPRSTFGEEGLRDLLVTLPTDRTTLGMLATLARETARVGLATLLRVVAVMERAGEIELSRHPNVDDRLVYFTPLGAHVARVELNEDSTQWLPLDRPHFRHMVPRSLIDEDGLAWNMIDRRDPDPLERVISMEEGNERDRHAMVVNVLGVTSTILLPRGKVDPHECPIHPGRVPRGREYCLYCESYGGSNEPADPPRVAVPPG